MAIVIEGYVNIAGKRSNCEFPAYPGVPGRFYEVIMPDAFKMSLLQTTCIKLKVDHTRVIGSTHSGELQLADDSRGLWAHALISDPAYSGTTVNVKNVEEEKPWSFMKLKEILRP